jgi:1-acyl-sn-glycerol-3-phosphate acyltransferase
VAGDPWLYRVARLLLVPAARLYGRFDVHGAGHLPSSGPALIVANHPSDIDPILVALPLPRTLHFMTDAVQFDRPFVGWCIRRLGAFPVHRGAFARDALQHALALLRRGHVVAVFPEGEVHSDAVGEFEAGVAFLAEKSGAPVVPVAIAGADGLPAGSEWRELPALLRRRRALLSRWRSRPNIRMAVGPSLCLVAGERHDYRLHAARLGRLIDDLRAA